MNDSTGFFPSLLRWAFVGSCALAGLISTGVQAQTEAPAAALDARKQVDQFLSNYRLAAGDVLTVRVFGEPDLSSAGIKLTDTGTVFLPTIGEIRVGGLTLGEIEKAVVDSLRGRILVNPRVSVSIDQYRSFFINGMVRSSGAYPYQPGLTVRKAASLAGGLQERASTSKIFVIRGDDTQQRSQRIGLDDIVYPGDIVTVEESFF